MQATERAMRADARRNYGRLLAAAGAAFAEHGADDASLEEVARRAGVGIGTLYRHFPSRRDLLEAVFRDQVQVLRARADELLRSPDPAEALVAWLQAMADFGRTKRNLTSSLLDNLRKDSAVMSSCGAVLRESAAELLGRAQREGSVRADATAQDLLRLAHAVSLVSDAAGAGGDLDPIFSLMVDGLRVPPGDKPAAGAGAGAAARSAAARSAAAAPAGPAAGDPRR